MAGNRCDRDPRSGPSGRSTGKKGGAQAQALGRSRGGFVTKVHAVVDALGLPIRFILGPGQQNDMAPACDLVRGIPAGKVPPRAAYRELVRRSLGRHFPRSRFAVVVGTSLPTVNTATTDMRQRD